MEILIRFLLLCAFMILLSHAEDTVLLNTHIRMIPKIMALDTQVLSHNPSGKAVLAVVYDEHKNSAVQIAKAMNTYYNEKVGGLPFIAIALSIEELINHHDIAFAYATQMNSTSIAHLAKWGTMYNVPTFSYDPSELEHGILGSIVIERNTIIYISKNTLKAGKFRFNNALFQIVRLVE